MKPLLNEHAIGPLWVLEPKDATSFDHSMYVLQLLEFQFNILRVRGSAIINCPASEADAVLTPGGEHVRGCRDPYRDTLDPAATCLIRSRRNLPLRLSFLSSLFTEEPGGLVLSYVWTLAFYDTPMKKFLDALRLAGVDLGSQRRHTLVKVRGIGMEQRSPDVEVISFTILESQPIQLPAVREMV